MNRRARARPDRGTRAVVLAVDDDPVALATLEAELGKRYGEDYDVWCEASLRSRVAPAQGLQERRSARGARARQSPDGRPPRHRAARAGHELHPTAKRGLLISWGDRSTAEPMLQAMAVGQFDYYVPKPSAPPDEGFHSIVEGFLAIGPSCAAAGSHRSLHRTPPRRSFDSDRSRAADEKVPAQSRRSFLPVMTRLPTGDGCRWCRSRVRPGRAW